MLGYAPDRVDAPGPALEQLIAARPDHPYALLGAEVVGDALSWFAQIVPSGPLPGYVYGGSLEHNQLLPTAVGALRPSALVPETMANGEASRTAARVHRRHARAARLPPQPVRGQPRARRASRPAR